MRRFIIDTDTASDDAVALIMALRERSIHIEGVTVVAGNVPIDLALKNALVSIEVANTYTPPVCKGMSKPLLRDLYTSEFVHGNDGMGNMNLQEPSIKHNEKHAVDAIIDMVGQYPYEIEIITLGPLTNIAMAYLKAPEILKKVKSITIMGSAGLGSGNITPVAEFNVYADAEAFGIVIDIPIPKLIVGWDVSMDKTFIDENDLEYMLSLESPIADFCVRCNASVKEFNKKKFGKTGFDLPDPTAVAAALRPDMILDFYDAFIYVETKGELTYGQVIIDNINILNKKPNARVCKRIDNARFKEYLFELIK
ncbi:MAG TPA: nucleoside hydrolase [Bacillota bacterium]|nr:nucleoside hydrolase [Bacillota bacterium]